MVPKFTAHPWHGVSPGEEAPDSVNTFIEIVPSDTLKYEIDKESGLLKVDRPQKFSNIIPCLYGFIPRTYCSEGVEQLAIESGSQDVKSGDFDPLDICVLSSHQINSGGILMRAVPIGGFKMIDKGEADDKIIAVAVGDQTYGSLRDITQLPEALVMRLKHYFLTYKNLPHESSCCRIDQVYGVEHAKKVIKASMEDYQNKFEK